MAFDGPCHRRFQSAYQPVSDLLFWFGDGGIGKRGNYWTYVHVLLKEFTGEREKVKKDDLGLGVNQLWSAMEDRKYWKQFVRKSGK